MSDHPFEEKTDDWRQVWVRPIDMVGYWPMGRPASGYMKLQRKHLVGVGAPRSATEDPPFDFTKGTEIPYRPVPGGQLLWVEVKEEWKDIPIHVEGSGPAIQALTIQSIIT